VRRSDIVLLSPLCAAAKEYDDRLPIPAEIHAIARAEIDTIFKNAAAHAFGIRSIALLQPRDRDRYLGCGLWIEPIKPRPNGLWPAVSRY
jgi:hypothetical protein